MLADGDGDSIDHGLFLPGIIVADRYRIVALLGKGGMGEVYRADDLKLGQPVALKFLHADVAKDPQRRDRFRQEVRIARQVSHPNVCRVYDIGEIEGHTYLSMEYVDGEDLSALLRRIGRVPHDKAVEIARQVCLGLAAAHEQGILHRDLKPANVMVDGRGNARITDFGLATLSDELASAPKRAGTPAYMSPEQLNNQQSNARSDIYTLGLALYELFTGKRAFKADTLVEYRRLHTEVMPIEPAKVVDNVEPAVNNVIMRCLEKDAALRPSSPLEVLAELPGTDPLAATLAAGETPSPELVAASVPGEGVPPFVAAACLVVTLAAMLVFTLLSDHVKLHGYVPLERRPEVMVDRAQEIVDRLGYAISPADRAWGFRYNDAYMRSLNARESADDRWSELALGRPAALEMWFRQSPQMLVPQNTMGVVTYEDPPPTTPGMVRMRLDTIGRLISFEAVPPERARSASPLSPGMPGDWTPLLAEAQLDPHMLTRTEPEFVPPVYCDRRAAWIGSLPQDPKQQLRVEAGMFLGRPTYFRIVYPTLEEPVRAGELTALQAGRLVNVVLVIVLLIGGASLARRNLALGRGDRRGAFRVAAFVGAALLGDWALRANHVPHASSELRLLAVAAGRSLVAAAIVWLSYVALEPYVRRRWPDMLISWNRLLAGRWRDAIVGRDLLIGSLFGVLSLVLTELLYFAPVLFGSPPPQPGVVTLETTLGLRYRLAELLNVVTGAVVGPLAVLLLLLLLLVLLRYRRLALAALFVILVALVTLFTLQPGENAYVSAAVYGVVTIALLAVLMRFGLLAVMAAAFCMLLLSAFPITSVLGAWYVESSYFALVIAAGLAVFGFVTSLGGRRILRRSVLLD